MVTILLIFVCGLLANGKGIYAQETNSSSVEITDEHNVKVSENRIAAQIFAVLDHYKQDDPVGLPGLEIPDPMPIPDIRKSLGMATLNMRKVLAYDLSKFRIKYIRGDLKDLKVNAGIELELMKVVGMYTLSSFFSKAEGPFVILLKNVFVAGNASLAVERNGKIRTQDIQMDITFSDMSMDFQNLGFLGAVFQGVVNSAPTLVFDAMKPFILTEAYTKIRNELDSHIEKASGDVNFPNSVSPLDMSIAELRKMTRKMGYDPYRIPDYNRTVGVFSMEMRNTWITGLSSFYRVGNVTLTMENNILSMRLHVGTQKIDGATQWEIAMGKGMIYRAGHAQFSVQHLKASIELSQPLDTRKRPKIEDIQLDLGNIQVRCDGAGTLDYVLEFVVNVLPNILRYQIMDAIENPIKQRVQERLNQIEVEKSIKDNWDYFQNMGSNFTLDFNFNL